jgi:hypothetical protein
VTSIITLFNWIVVSRRAKKADREKEARAQQSARNLHRKYKAGLISAEDADRILSYTDADMLILEDAFASSPSSLEM